MPFKSRAQYRKFKQLVGEGKISQEVMDEWTAATPDLKALPNRLKPKKKKKKASFVAGLKKTAKDMQSLAGITDAAMSKHNKKVIEGMRSKKPLFTLRDLKTLYPGAFMRGVAKTAEANMSYEANQQSGWSTTDYVPGEVARNNASTGQFKGKSYRTEGVQNEGREMKQSLKTKAQTARGGKHYGGTISEGIAENR